MILLKNLCTFISYRETKSTPNVAQSDNWKLKLNIIYGLLKSRIVVANPKELRESGSDFAKGEVSSTKDISDERKTEGENPVTVQKPSKKMMQKILRIFFGILKSFKTKSISPHQREVCKPDTARRWDIPPFRNASAILSGTSLLPPNISPLRMPEDGGSKKSLILLLTISLKYRQ